MRAATPARAPMAWALAETGASRAATETAASAASQVLLGGDERRERRVDAVDEAQEALVSDALVRAFR
jgi:hypothetical protein